MSGNKTERQKSFWTPARLALSIVVLSLFAAFGASSCNSSDEVRVDSPNPPKTNPPKTNAPPNAPAALTTLPPKVLDSELKSLNGAPIKLSSYAGKALVVNLWATWCGPCRNETPELVKLYTDNRSRGLEVVGLSTENPTESAEKVRKFVQDFDVNYRIGWATAEVAITLMQGRDAIPQSFVIGRDGRIIKRFIGYNPTTTPPQLKEAVEEALSGNAPSD